MVAITNVFILETKPYAFLSGCKRHSHRSVGFISGDMVMIAIKIFLTVHLVISEVTPLGPICPLELPAEPLVK
jgi:hypothetical protein